MIFLNTAHGMFVASEACSLSLAIAGMPTEAAQSRFGIMWALTRSEVVK